MTLPFPYVSNIKWEFIQLHLHIMKNYVFSFIYVFYFSGLQTAFELSVFSTH